MGTWDKSILNAYAPKSVKTTDNSFYEDYQKKKTQQQKETEYRAKPVQRIIDSGEKKTKKKSEEKGSTESAKSEPVRVQLDNPFNRDSQLFQSFQPFSERKKTGNVFTPSTLFTRNRQMFQADMPRLRETAKQNMSFGRATRKAAENPFADGDVVFDDIMKNYTKADGGRYYRALNLNRAVNNLLRNWRNTEKNMPGNKGYENTWNTYKANNAGDIQLYEKLTGRKFDPVELGDLDAKAVNQAKKTVERKYNEAYQNRVEQHYNTVSSPDFAAYANRQGVFAKKSKVDDVINNMKLMTEAEYIKANPRVTDLSKLNRYYDAGSGKEYIVLGLNSEKQSDVNILYMNDTERKIYNYYLNKYGEGKANKYLDDIQMVLDARRVKNHQSIVEAKSHKDWVYGGLTSMKSGIENSVGLIDAPVQALKQNISTPSEYKPSNPYRVANEGVYTQQAAHQGIERDMSPTGKWIAERVLSVTDQAPSRIVSLAGMPHLGLGMMAGAAGTQARVDAISRGATEAQAGMYGLTSGTIEYLTEALPLFQWVELFKAPKGQLISFFKNLAINSATEAGEEVIADYANAAADRVINGDKSQVNQYINELMQDGMSKEQAQEGAYWKYFVLEPAQDAGAAFVDSLLMGVAPGVTAPISETLDTGAELKNLGVTQSVVDTGLESDTSTAARKYAERMQAKQDEGKPLSDWNVGRQYQKNVKAIEQENATQRAFQNATNIVREQQQNLPNNVNGMFTPAYNEQGQLDTRNSKIETSLNSDTSQLANDKHEYYHGIRRMASTEAAKYEKYAYDILKGTEAIETLEKTVREVYNETDPEKVEDIVKDEIGALTAEMLSFSPEQLQRIADNKTSIADRAVGALDKARAKVQTALAKKVGGRFGIEYTPEQLNELKGLWASTVRQASENVRNGNLAQGEGGDRYSFAGVNSQTADMESLADVNTQTEEKGSVKEQITTPQFKDIDAEYLNSIQKGDMEKAARMVHNRATEMGYTADSSYQGTSAFNGAAPSNEGYYDSQAERMTAFENGEGEGSIALGDFIKNKASDIGGLEMFMTNPNVYKAATDERKEAIRNLRKVIDGKQETITMYRSVPSNVVEKSFRNGDWITPSKSYAIDNAQVHGWGDDYNIITQDVSVDDVWWDGNDIAEWGYDDDNGNKVYKNTENNVKLDTVTYDDDGNIIPLSKRFDKNNPDIRYSVKEQITTPQFKEWFGDWENDPENASKIVNEDGTPKNLYHQTDSDFTVFNTDNERAGQYDSETPTGIFLKSKPNDIGISGKKQMAVYANIRNMLEFADRAEARQYWIDNVPGYKELQNRLDKIENNYNSQVEAEEEKVDKWYEENYDDIVNGKYTDEELEQILNGNTEEILSKWYEAENPIRRQMKELLNNYIANSDYDGIHLKYDGGNENKATDAYIVFDSTQIKSATDNIGTFDKNNPDIRYSMREDDRPVFRARGVNDIVNDTNLTPEERQQELQARADEAREMFRAGQERGKAHFDKQQNVKKSEYSEEDWASLDRDLDINNASEEMDKRVAAAEEQDNSRYDREDWESLMENGADLDDILPQNYDWSKDAENWDKPKQKSEADEMTSAEKLRTLMEEKGVSSPSELAEKTVSRDDTRKRNNAFYRTKAGIHTLMSRAYTAMVDDMHPLWQYTDSFEKSQTRLDEKGKKVTPRLYGKENAYKMAMNAKDASSRAAYLITDYLTDFDANIIGKGLVDTIVDEGGISTQDYDAFNEYLVAKHALEWLSEDSGGKYKKVYADDMMNDVGVVSEIVKDFEAKYPHFAAASELVYDWQRKLMKAWLVDTGVISEDQYNYLTETYPCYVPFYRETGVASVGGHTGFANLDDVLKKASGSGERILSPIENIMYNVASYVNHASKHAVTKAAVDMYDILESDPANNILRNFWEEVIPKNPKEFEPTQFVKKDEVLDATEEAPGLSISDSLKAQTGVQGNIVTVMDDGKPRYFEVKDKDFLNVLDNVRKGREGWLAIFAAASRVRGALLTTFKPQFALVTNPIRDFGTLLVNSSDANKAKIMGAAVSSYGDIIKKSENYQKWKAMGGEYSSFATEGKNDLRKAMQKLDPSTAKKVVRKVMSAFGVYSNFANAIETAPRLGEYKQAVKAGYDVHEAFYRGKDVTINFSRGGKLAKYANSVSNFFNAAVQGTDKFFRQAKNNPTSFAVGMGVLALISLLKYGWDKWMEDDKYKEAYKDLSNYQKNNSWNFYIGNGKFVSLPKPRENAVLISLMEAAVDRYVEGQDDRFKGFLKHAIGTFLPDGSVLGVSDYIALRANKDYRDVPIVGKELEKLPKELQFDDSTSYAAKWLGGLLKQSPKQIDYLINSNAGVLGTANKTYFTPKSTKDKAAMYTFGLSNTFLKDAYYSTDMVTNFYNNKDEADKQANGYPSADTAYLSNRYYQANNVMGIINGMVKDNAENTKPFDMMEAFRWYRRAYTNYAAENKDNPKGFSDEVYQEIKGLYDTDNTVLQLPKVDSTIKANKQEYTFDDPYTVMQYQTDLNNAVDKAYRDIIGTAEYQVKSNDDKAAALKKAKDDAVKAVKKLYVENGGKVTSEAAPKGAINKPSAETVAVAQQKADRRANVQSTYVEQLSANFKAANPTKDGYSVDTMLKLEPTEVTIGDKKYKVSGDVAKKIASAAEDKFYDNIESFYSGDTSIEYLIGSGKKTPKYAEDKNGKRVYMTGSRYNADGSKRFDETVEGKIIFKLKEAAVNSAAKEYEAEVKGEGTSNNTAENGINAGAPSDSFVRTPVGNYRKSSNKSSGRKSSGRKSSGRKSSGGSRGGRSSSKSSSKSSGTKVAKTAVSFKPSFTPSFSFTPKTTTARLRFKPRLSGYNKVRNTRLRLGNKKGVIV